jgi:hypothetical protein
MMEPNMTEEQADETARALGCTHRVRSRIVTRPDSQGYEGGELWALATYYGRYRESDGTFIERFHLGFSTNPESPRNVHEFPQGREWSPVILRAQAQNEVSDIARL